jgi:beta-glucanase (GH16 family)
MRNIPLFIDVLIMLSFFMGQSCKQSLQDKQSQASGYPREEVNEIIIEAENHAGSSSEFGIQSIAGNMKYVNVPDEGWLSYEIPIPVAGRYRTEVLLAAGTENGASCWMEDYFDNPHDRTYNITGKMFSSPSGNNQEFVSVFRDGSPLNKGLHKMKLHVDSGGAKIDRIKFTLLKEHRPTPQILTQKMSGQDWSLVWSDEFEEDGLPDTIIWTFDIGDWGWGNNELQYYTEGRLENARKQDGDLIIEARKDDLNGKWTSARLTTRGKVSFVYGKIELRAKVPAERGNWAAGWTLGDKYIDELSWPFCGEIDMLESVGYEMDDESGDGYAHASIHCGAYYFKLNNHPTSSIAVKNMKDEYHTYAMEWYPDKIMMYVDDNHYFTYQDTTTDLSWPYDQPQNIILNLAMGGGWGGAEGMDEKVNSQKFIIDYVRVYDLK